MPNEDAIIPFLPMGQIALVSSEEELTITLGSCLAVILFDPMARRAIASHCLLATCKLQEIGAPGKYINTAIPEMIQQITKAGSLKRNLAAKIVGGANMFPTQLTPTIGESNREMAVKLLAEFSIPLRGEHCGGKRGRKVFLFPGQSKVQVQFTGDRPFDI